MELAEENEAFFNWFDDPTRGDTSRTIESYTKNGLAISAWNAGILWERQRQRAEKEKNGN